MGRKSNKAKEKKLKRKEENARMAASQIKVDAANKIEDPLAMFPAFQKFERNGLNLTIEFSRAVAMEPSLMDWVFKLTKSNMKDLYEGSNWGWKDKEKRDELSEAAACYLLVRDLEAKPVAFVHFRFDMDFDDEVLYVYEVQLEKEVQRKGLGKFLMQILELMAHKTEMKKVIQTVFAKNDAGYNFYTKTMKYEIDETSPDEYVFEKENSYVILSKLIKPRKTASSEKTNGSSMSSAVTNGSATHVHGHGCC